MSEYYLVKYDNHHGNMNYKNKLVIFLNDNGFSCVGGFWGMPIYWINIKNKTYIPGRPGVSFGKIIGNKPIIFTKFKRIYKDGRQKI